MGQREEGGERERGKREGREGGTWGNKRERERKVREKEKEGKKRRREEVEAHSQIQTFLGVLNFHFSSRPAHLKLHFLCL